MFNKLYSCTGSGGAGRDAVAGTGGNLSDVGTESGICDSERVRGIILTKGSKRGLLGWYKSKSTT